MPKATNASVSAPVRARMSMLERQLWRPVKNMSSRPDEVQRDVLLRLISANRDTRFGVEHSFEHIRDFDTFRARVPVQDYETLRPYIDQQRRSGTPALTAEAPVYYAQTSGTTGARKYIPITPSMMAMQQAEQALFTYLQFRACPQGFLGKAMGIMGAAVEERLDTGHVAGSVSGHLYQSLPKMLQARFVIPPEVSNIQDYELKYLVIARLALAESGITYIASPNPSTFLRLLDVANARREKLLRSLETGKIRGLDGLAAPLRKVLAPRLRPKLRRAAALRKLATLSFANAWPRIRLVTTWTGGSCGIALEKLRKELPDGAVAMEMGYQSSEFLGTLALEAETSSGLPPLHHHFFEFVSQDAWDSGDPRFQTLGELEIHGRYYVVITTASGLYRYFMNDLLEVTGHFRGTPLLRFLQKGKGVTSLTGEKLYEAQAIEAVRDAAAKYGFTASFFLLVADEEASAYRLWVEADGAAQDARAIAAAVDHRLGELNIEYHSKRASERLHPLSLGWLKPGAAEACKAAAVRKGQREGQFKPTVLQYRKDLNLRLEDYLVP